MYWMYCFALIGQLTFIVSQTCADDWHQWRGINRDGVWHESGLIETFGTESLQPVWVSPVSAGFSGPTVAQGRVFVMDKLTDPQEMERILCLDEQTGHPLWEFKYPVKYDIDYGYGPRTSVAIMDGKAFSLGAMGYAVCIDIYSGIPLWQRDLKTDFAANIPVWGAASSPLVFDDKVIYQVGGSNGACILALETSSGKEVWRALDEKNAYSSPILIEQGGKPVVVCWTAESFSGINPNDGSVYWSYPFKPKSLVSNIPTPVFDGHHLFFTCFYDGSFLFKINHETMGIELLWERGGRNERNTDALHSTMSTPLIIDDSIYGVDSYGQLRCLEKMTGNRVWEDLTAVNNIRWGTGFMVQNGDRCFLFNDQGELIICRLTPQGYDEISRTALIEPNNPSGFQSSQICWMHPAFANKHIFVRNDKEIRRYSLAQ